MTGLDVTPEQLETLQALLDHFLPSVAVWAYGSRVKRTARRYSDLDLVVFVTSEQRTRVAELREALDESNLPFSVDVLIRDELPESFQRNIDEWYVVVQEGSDGMAESLHYRT
ncbi:MAG: type I restriction enzyme, S subunit [Candidatus Kentron sp. G]|nr:MAG: type I restriction enzyme, S subunit [Candidatus Kentron sp. G]VFM99666.1 MAG: type I restriction enzyme, S subunit [Candidatus Kentron sp. G]VFN03164.1 MAG: type I restriction enzyme, S subunit [Candidatus Kentron sp. G]